MARTRSSGFTLIELLLTVILVAILAAIAIPSYSAYVVRGQRAAAKVALEQAAQYLERNYTAYGCYNYATQANCTGQTGTQLALPTSLASAPTDGGPATYAITLPTATLQAQGFILNATPCGATGANCPSGSNTTFTDLDCGVLSLDNTGLKGASGSLGPATCWQR
jgi:type IV pilus assembly protein PilE